LLKIELDEEKSISLVGYWNYKVGVNWDDLTSLFINPDTPSYPTVLSNAMIEPIIPYRIKGVIWYQGESNVGEAYKYQKLFPTLIKDWRQRWGSGDFPFLFVQLANYMNLSDVQVEDTWAELREAQFMTLQEPNTGMAITIDIGDAEDIHPKNKQEVGRRLALNALKLVYNKDIIHTGPLFKSFIINDNYFELKFENIGEGLVVINGNGTLLGFSIAGSDRKFIWANAEIVGDLVKVWNPLIDNPIAVRYSWASNPIGNLVNSAQLPASPFRTDNWPGVTGP
ncbi:MAG: sialate O-acetylesterase, partial [Candidatus Marinimicrobia bacterium]|nr:sialate O-acetylesterase [Candidatus Neomarinimicrobiota bacterium]